MVESINYKNKIIENANLMQRVLENFQIKELVEWRKFNKKLANEVFSRCVKHMICKLPDANDEDDDYTFHKILKYPRKVEI